MLQKQVLLKHFKSRFFRLFLYEFFLSPLSLAHVKKCSLVEPVEGDSNDRERK